MFGEREKGEERQLGDKVGVVFGAPVLFAHDEIARLHQDHVLFRR